MRDQEVAFALLLVTLREGQIALADALEMLETHEPEMATFHRLLEATRELADQAQAQALVLLMEESRADKASLVDANDLTAFFWTTEERIEAKLGLG